MSLRSSKPGKTSPEMNLLTLVFCHPSNALAWVDRSGRGCNPRPAQGRKAPPPPNVPPQFQTRKNIPRHEPFHSCFLSSIQCPRVGGSFRSGVQPPTGSRSESSTTAKCPPRNSKSGKTSRNESFHSCFLSSIQCTRVGGSFQVGGATPDRLKVGKLHHRQMSLRSSKPGKTSPDMNLFTLVFCHPSNAFAWVDRSGRGQPPTGSRPAQTGSRSENSTPAKYPPAIPNSE